MCCGRRYGNNFNWSLLCLNVSRVLQLQTPVGRAKRKDRRRERERVRQCEWERENECVLTGLFCKRRDARFNFFIRLLLHLFLLLHRVCVCVPVCVCVCVRTPTPPRRIDWSTDRQWSGDRTRSVPPPPPARPVAFRAREIFICFFLVCERFNANLRSAERKKNAKEI